ncbi:SpoIIE family protein phosphatase [bacterium]|nr:SpoIIE family protein phosphatase [bacterium]
MINIMVGTAQEPARGQNVCGDVFDIIPNGQTLTIAMADGLGHGPLAAEAAREFCSFVKTHKELPIDTVLEKSHKDIAHTRGTAGVVLNIDREKQSLTFAGIGNIELQAISAHPIRPICSPGVIGHRYHKILVFKYELTAGDLIAIYTDGISSRFQLKNYRHLQVDTMANAILQDHKKYHDDRTCITLFCH